MNRIFKVVWSASKQCYVVASELATNTRGKKKIMVATVLVALVMGGSLQVGAETTVTADKVSTTEMDANRIKVENNGIITRLNGSDISIAIGDNRDSRVTQLQPGLIGAINDETKFMYGEVELKSQT